MGEEILEYLSEVSLFINGACGENCPGCRTYHQQFLCCTCKKRSRKELSPENVSDLLNQIKGSALARLNILGGNILLYSRKSDLAQILKAHPASTTYYLHYRHLAAADEDIESLHFASASYRVMVTPPYLTGALTSALSKLPRLGPNATVVWVVQDAKDVERAQTMNATHRISRLSLKPFYNGRNMNFFRQHVFMNLENIFEAAPTQMEIYANMMINRLKFGRLMVANNGNVHAGLNAPVLGRLGKQAVIEMLCKEMSGGRTWRKIRRKVSPCQDCVLADLCPPIGTYEAVLKRNDLCHARWV